MAYDVLPESDEAGEVRHRPPSIRSVLSTTGFRTRSGNLESLNLTQRVSSIGSRK